MSSSRSFIGLLLLTCLLGFLSFECNPTYSPPVKAYYYPSPGRTEAGTLSAQGTWSALMLVDISGSVGYAPADYLQIEASGEYFKDHLAVGNLTFRASPWPAIRQQSSWKFLQDFEVGMGGGVGGELYGNDYQTCIDDNESPKCDRLGWNDRSLYGGYFGVGLGVGYTWNFANRYVRELDFDVFFRSRYQATQATNIPLTHWYEPALGVQFRFNHFVKAGIASAGHFYWNDYNDDSTVSWLELTLGFDFDLFHKEKKDSPESEADAEEKPLPDEPVKEEPAPAEN